VLRLDFLELPDSTLILTITNSEYRFNILGPIFDLTNRCTRKLILKQQLWRRDETFCVVHTRTNV